MAEASLGTASITASERPKIDHDADQPETKITRSVVTEVEEAENIKYETDEKAPKGLWDKIQAPFGGWLLDYIAVLVSGLSIVGLSLFLHRFNWQPAPIWSYSAPNSLSGNSKHVSINSILEIFSTTARIAIGYSLTKALGQLTWVWFKKDRRQLTDFGVFDQAAKHSPVGSVKLIMMLKGRHFAVIGALVALGLQVFGFFVHQLVSIKQGQFPDPLDAPYPFGAPQMNSVEAQQMVKSWYDKQQQNPNITVPIPPELSIARLANASVYPADVSQASTHSIETLMKGYIWAALYGSDSNSDWSIPSYHCDTGNCTWIGYSSLGICSRCADISSKLVTTCTAEPALDLSQTTAGCDSQLPNGFSLGGPERTRNHLMAMSTGFSPLVYGNYSNPLAIIQTIAAYDTKFVNSSSHLNASECVLFPCGILYNNATSYNAPSATQYTNGILFSEFAEEIYDNYTIGKDGVSITVKENPTVVGLWFTAPEKPIINNPTTYNISMPAFIAIQNYLTSLFNGFVVTDGQNVTFQGDNKTRAVLTNNADAMEAVWQPIDTYYCTDIFWTQLTDRVICSVASMSQAMTNVIRGFAPANFNFDAYQVTGMTIRPQPMVVAGWLWIIPVVALWLLSIVLLAGTVWKTKQSGVSKAVGLNPLALIFLGIEEDEEEKAKGQWWHSEDEVKKKAERMTVRLSLAGKRAALVQRAQDHDE